MTVKEARKKLIALRDKARVGLFEPTMFAELCDILLPDTGQLDLQLPEGADAATGEGDAA